MFDKAKYTYMHIKKLSIAPEDVMAIFHNTDYALWMDSADQSHPNSIWSFVMANPIETICVRTGKTFWNNKEIFANCAFDFVQVRLNSLFKNIKNFKTDIPFIGGAAGYFGYDLGRGLENLPNILPPSQTPDMMIGIYDQIYAYNNQQKQGFLITHGTENDIKTKENKFIKSIDKSSSRNLKIPNDFHTVNLNWRSEKTREQYQKDVSKIIEYIYAGEIYQANLTHRFDAELPENFSPYLHYLNLRKINAAPFSGYFHTDAITISSASPERFIQCNKKGQIEAKPIKGTMPVSANAAINEANKNTLLNSEKDHAENIMIVDLLRNDLSKCAKSHSVSVPKLCALESFTHVHHLVSTVTATLAKNKTSLNLLKASFPGGSITGAPKIRAQEIIEELETYRRGVYCGSLGYIGFDGAMDTNILIRTLVYENNKVHFNVGGGIVADSNPANEYQETLDKAAGLFASFSSPHKTKEIIAA